MGLATRCLLTLPWLRARAEHIVSCTAAAHAGRAAGAVLVLSG
jgi:hypothetical protein